MEVLNSEQLIKLEVIKGWNMLIMYMELLSDLIKDAKYSSAGESQSHLIGLYFLFSQNIICEICQTVFIHSDFSLKRNPDTESLNNV